MKLTVKIGAAISIAAFGGCTQTEQDNSSNFENTATGEETVLPPDESGGETDTLGNQLNQLDESDAGGASETANDGNSS